jgi:hypothetical protein
MNLANGTTASSISCGGYSWSTTGGSYYGIGTENSASSCANDPAYAIRPDVGTANWGGIGTTCNGAASQHLELVFDY